MDEEYDVIVCGTGLKECILSGVFSSKGKKVLHIDRNPYYGGESASLNLTNLFARFRGDEKPPAVYGANRDWNVDVIPKFIMACGKLVKMLLSTKVTAYLEWQVIEGTYVYQQTKGFFNSKSIHKVPSTATEVMTSSLMGVMEKRRCRSFFQYCAEWNKNDASTWKGFDPDTTTTQELFDYFNLQQNTIDFVGHAVALYTNDDYLHYPVANILEKVSLYMYSISQYGKSPFIYPMYGLGGLPEGFSRLSAIHGGTYMLNMPVNKFHYDEEGKVCGVEAVDGSVAKTKMVICDPSYVKDVATQNKVKRIGKVIRCICILSEAIPDTNGVTSCQIIIPQKQLGRKHDIYIMMISSTHGVALKGKYIASVSTVVETEEPEAEIELALKMLGNINDKFFFTSDIWESTCNGASDNVYVSDSFDATSHFESSSDDVLRMYKEITGEDFDLSANVTQADLQEGQ